MVRWTGSAIAGDRLLVVGTLNGIDGSLSIWLKTILKPTSLRSSSSSLPAAAIPTLEVESTAPALTDSRMINFSCQRLPCRGQPRPGFEPRLPLSSSDTPPTGNATYANWGCAPDGTVLNGDSSFLSMSRDTGRNWITMSVGGNDWGDAGAQKDGRPVTCSSRAPGMRCVRCR